MTGHLGYEPHDPVGRGSGNSRNGTITKTVLTDVGAIEDSFQLSVWQALDELSKGSRIGKT